MLNRLSSIASRILATIFFGLIPARGRRMFYLTSVYFYLSQNGVFEKMTLRDFKQKGLELTDVTDSSLKLPLISKDFIWDSTGIKEAVENELLSCPISGCLSMDTASRAATEILRSTPAWLRYNPADMRRDTVRLCYISQL